MAAVKGSAAAARGWTRGGRARQDLVGGVEECVRRRGGNGACAEELVLKCATMAVGGGRCMRLRVGLSRLPPGSTEASCTITAGASRAVSGACQSHDGAPSPSRRARGRQLVPVPAPPASAARASHTRAHGTARGSDHPRAAVGVLARRPPSAAAVAPRPVHAGRVRARPPRLWSSTARNDRFGATACGSPPSSATLPAGRHTQLRICGESGMTLHRARSRLVGWRQAIAVSQNGGAPPPPQCKQARRAS